MAYAITAQERSGPSAISFNRAMRFSTLGCLENRLSIPAPELTMQRWAEAGLRSAWIGHLLGNALNLAQGGSEREGTFANLGADPVRLVFAPAADLHLHKARGERPQVMRRRPPMAPTLLSLLRPPPK